MLFNLAEMFLIIKFENVYIKYAYDFIFFVLYFANFIHHIIEIIVLKCYSYVFYVKYKTSTSFLDFSSYIVFHLRVFHVKISMAYLFFYY